MVFARGPAKCARMLHLLSLWGEDRRRASEAGPRRSASQLVSGAAGRAPRVVEGCDGRRAGSRPGGREGAGW